MEEYMIKAMWKTDKDFCKMLLDSFNSNGKMYIKGNLYDVIQCDDILDDEGGIAGISAIVKRYG